MNRILLIFKFIIYSFTLSILILSCDSESEISAKYNIIGEIYGHSSDDISLMKYEDGELVNVATSTIQKNKFNFPVASINNPELYYLKVGDNDAILEFFLENSKIDITIDLKNKSKVKISGSKTHDEYSSFLENNFAFETKQNYLYKQADIAKENNDTVLLNQLDSTYQSIYSEQVAYIKQFVKQNPKSYVASFIASRSLSNIVSEKELEEIYKNIDSTIHQSVYFAEIAEKVNVNNSLLVNKEAPNFSLKDTTLNDISLNDFKGNSVLLHFWMSKSEKSQKMNQLLNELWNKYNNKNFEIVAISLDVDTVEYINSIKKNKLKFINLTDFKGMNSEIVKKYNIKKVPSNLLLNENGIILAKNISTTELEQFLNKNK